MVIRNKARDILKFEENCKEKPVCIFGTGMKAAMAFIELTNYGIHVQYFADRISVSTEYTSAFSRIVLSEEEVIHEWKNKPIIIASSYWMEIANRLTEKGCTDLYISSESKYSPIIKENVLKRCGNYNFNENTYYILCPYGIGDLLLWGGAIKIFREKHSNIARVCLIVKKSLENIAKSYSSVDEVIASDTLRDQLMVFSLKWHVWELKNYYWGHVRHNWDFGQMVMLDGKVMGKGFEILPGVVLDRPIGSELWMSGQFESPKLDLKNCITYNSKLTNTIVLMPYAKSVSLIDEGFWEKLAMTLNQAGYEVVTNIAGNEKPIAGTVALSLGILETVQFCSECKAVISLRSGFCDLLGIVTDIPIFVLNPNQEEFSSFNICVLWGRENAYNVNLFEQGEQCVEYILKLL